MQIMLDKGKELDWFASPLIVALGLVALVGFAFFLIWELTEEHPVVDLSLFSRRNFWVGTLALSLGFGTFFGKDVYKSQPVAGRRALAWPSVCRSSTRDV